MTKTTSFALCSAVAGAVLLAGVPGGTAVAQDSGMTAKNALINIANRFGHDRVKWICEMRGWEGQSQPDEWEIVLYDTESRSLLREYRSGENGEITNEGTDNDFYPKRSPTGFLSLKDLKLDSRAAFTIAEGEARKAKMGFNEVNYFLRAREYSREPIWTLELIDAEEEIAGKAYISGSSGEVLRTVWFFRGPRGRPDGKPLIMDSAAPRPGEEGSGVPVPAAPRTTGITLPPSPPGTTGPGETTTRVPIPNPTDDPARIPKPPIPPGTGTPVPPPATQTPPPPLPEPPVQPGTQRFKTTIPPPPVPRN